MSGSTKTHEATPALGVASFLSSPWLPACLGLLAFFSVLASIDVAQDVAWSANGPGLTFDEGLNVEGGVYVVESVLRSGLSAAHPATMSDIFNGKSYHPDYPPLGRLPLGLANAVLFRTIGADGHELYVITYARVASAVLFGLLVTLVSAFTRDRAGPVAGLGAGLAIWLTPRVFAHAHLASVETMMNLTYAACVLFTVYWLADRKTLRARDGILPGLFLGLALLTKIQAVFLPPVLAIWILYYWRKEGILPLLTLAGTSFVVFLLGWPWLWSDPLHRFFEYFAQTTDRVTLYCYYFGRRYADRDVPWHYPFVMFMLTTPLPALALGCWGATQEKSRKHLRSSRSRERQFKLTRKENQLLLGAFALPLVVFALPKVPVYDGERLFLVVWPIFAVWTGIGAKHAIDWARNKWNDQITTLFVAIAILVPLWTMSVLQPCQLSFYNTIIGGLRGASMAGLEPTYWGDSLTPKFLQRISDDIPEGARVGVAPVLHPLYLEGLRKDSWLRHRPDLTLVAYDDKEPNPPQYVLVIRRHADPWTSLTKKAPGTVTVGEVERQSVQLAELVKLPDPKPGPLVPDPLPAEPVPASPVPVTPQAAPIPDAPIPAILAPAQ
ncbi:ArnT family glycosyltransferase [Planctomicrobium piriforme]|uniref:Dolichyl-phosphate-mannose-protein mannosyltransferase n=1 Tax=Planctomicrobium piriforme TaxID=1576369 RepID=A0A1I3IL55_9PLAN|nr:glycosyltransferase family 39 protein [Planctomicrobium piriforme]SFI48600.1 Dolichyl-phosphate-mannose-protein mannosyltransferase [Planctomicrobium piriforme]